VLLANAGPNGKGLTVRELDGSTVRELLPDVTINVIVPTDRWAWIMTGTSMFNFGSSFGPAPGSPPEEIRVFSLSCEDGSVQEHPNPSPGSSVILLPRFGRRAAWLVQFIPEWNGGVPPSDGDGLTAAILHVDEEGTVPRRFHQPDTHRAAFPLGDELMLWSHAPPREAAARPDLYALHPDNTVRTIELPACPLPDSPRVQHLLAADDGSIWRYQPDPPESACVFFDNFTRSEFIEIDGPPVRDDTVPTANFAPWDAEMAWLIRPPDAPRVIRRHEGRSQPLTTPPDTRVRFDVLLESLVVTPMKAGPIALVTEDDKTITVPVSTEIGWDTQPQYHRGRWYSPFGTGVAVTDATGSPPRLLSPCPSKGKHVSGTIHQLILRHGITAALCIGDGVSSFHTVDGRALAGDAFTIQLLAGERPLHEELPAATPEAPLLLTCTDLADRMTVRVDWKLPGAGHTGVRVELRNDRLSLATSANNDGHFSLVGAAAPFACSANGLDASGRLGL
jgi:hypothetical protein